MKTKHAYLLLIIVLLLGGFSLFPIPYVHAAPTITFASNTMTLTGTSSSNFLWDFWNASHVNNWNVSSQTSENATKGLPKYDTQFSFNCKLQVGDGSIVTTATATNTQVIFADGVVGANYQDLLLIKNKATVTLGTLIDATEKVTKDGCQILSLEDTRIPDFYEVENGGTLNVYNSYLGSPDKRHLGKTNNGATLNMYNSLINRIYLDCGGTATIDLFDVTLSGDAYYYAIQGSGMVNQLFIHDYNWAVRFAAAASQNLTNIYGRRNTYTAYVRAITTDKYLVNPDFDTWAFDYSLTSTAEIYRQYEFDLTVIFANNTGVNGTSTGSRVVIQHYGNNSGVDYNATLGADGTIPTQTLNMGFYNQTGGNNLYTYNPYNLTIYNATGYQTYTKNFTLSEKTEWTIALTEDVIAVTYTSAIIIASLFLMIPVGGILYVWRSKQ